LHHCHPALSDDIVISIHVDGLRFDIADGILESPDHDTGAFEPVERPGPFSRRFGPGRRAAMPFGIRTTAE
jgi:hypothetical protein